MGSGHSSALDFLRSGVLSRDAYVKLLHKYGASAGRGVSKGVAKRFVVDCDDALGGDYSLPSRLVLTQWIDVQADDIRIDFNALVLRVVAPLVASDALSLTTSMIGEAEERLASAEGGFRPAAIVIDWSAACAAQRASPVSALPRDVLALILAQNLASDIAAAARVCKQFFGAASVVLSKLRVPALSVLRYSLPCANATALATPVSAHDLRVTGVPPHCGVALCSGDSAALLLNLSSREGGAQLQILQLPGRTVMARLPVESADCGSGFWLASRWLPFEVRNQDGTDEEEVIASRLDIVAGPALALSTPSLDARRRHHISTNDTVAASWGPLAVVRQYLVFGDGVLDTMRNVYYPTRVLCSSGLVVVTNSGTLLCCQERRITECRIVSNASLAAGESTEHGIVVVLSDADRMVIQHVPAPECWFTNEALIVLLRDSNTLVAFASVDGFLQRLTMYNVARRLFTTIECTGFLPTGSAGASLRQVWLCSRALFSARSLAPQCGPGLVMLTPTAASGLAVGVVYFCKLSAGLWCCTKVPGALQHEQGAIPSGPPPEDGIVLVCRVENGRVELSVIAVDKRGDPSSWLPPALADAKRVAIAMHGQPMRNAVHALADCKKALLESLRRRE